MLPALCFAVFFDDNLSILGWRVGPLLVERRVANKVSDEELKKEGYIFGPVVDFNLAHP